MKRGGTFSPRPHRLARLALDRSRPCAVRDYPPLPQRQRSRGAPPHHLLSLPFISASAASAGGILQTPVLCLSHYFKKHRADYYDNLQAVRDTGDWERGLIFLLRGVIEFRGGGHGASGVSGRIEA